MAATAYMEVFMAQVNIVDEWRKALGAQLKEERRAQELSQDDLAALLGVHRRTVSDLETGNGKNLELLLTALCVHLDADFGLIAVKARQMVKAATIDLDAIE